MGYSAKQRKVKTKVEGADKLVKDIRAMEDAASSVLMTGAKAGGKIALDDARRNCPVDTGTLKASLKLNEGKATETKATVSVDYDKSRSDTAHSWNSVQGEDPPIRFCEMPWMGTSTR